MRLPRFTTRRLMALVAVVALVLAGWTTWRRRTQFRYLADYHVFMASACRATAKVAVESAASVDGPARDNPWLRAAEADNLKADRHDRLARQYHRAARYPWLPVPADPPEPE